MKNNLKVVIYTHPREFPNDVIKIFNKFETVDYEFGIGWYTNFIDTLAFDDKEVLFFSLYEGDSLLTVMPMRLIKNIFSCQLHSLSNYYSSLYTPLIDPKTSIEDLKFLFDYLKLRYHNLKFLRLEPMDPTSLSFSLITQGIKSSGLKQFEYFCFKNWYLEVKQTWDEYLQSRSSQVRNTLKRMGKRFKSQDGSLDIVTDESELDTALSDYEKIYSRSWKKPEPFTLFIPGLVKSSSRLGVLRMGIARLGGVAVAAQIWIVSNGKASIFKLAYDEDFKSYSPGTLLTQKMMQHVFEIDKVREVDYLTGDDEYKKSWMGDCRERMGIVAYNTNSIIGLLDFLRELMGRYAKRYFLRNTGLH